MRRVYELVNKKEFFIILFLNTPLFSKIQDNPYYADYLLYFRSLACLYLLLILVFNIFDNVEDDIFPI